MTRSGIITQKMLKEYEGEVSTLADIFCDTGQWNEDEWETVYNEIVIPLRNIAVALGDLAVQRNA